MKLQSMTDFVLEQNEIALSKIITAETKDSISDCIDADFNFRKIISNYANFLKQPLTLGMFVPVDKHGVVLQPLQFCCTGSVCGCMGMPVNVGSQGEIDEYYEAKERVLFEGFKIPKDEWHKDNDTVYNEKIGITIYLKSETISIQQSCGIGYGVVKTIEDLCQYGLELTPSAIKSIGL
ncbi:hypothetical protein [Chryseobacterium rhizosphaerae]|uniref:hypothetical protein n=1 Tax=Chryseobacterium rhizosphaerae TaxID=395937 RepID=UPI003D144B5B